MRETWNAAREYYALSNAFKTYFSIYLKPRDEDLKPLIRLGAVAL